MASFYVNATRNGITNKFPKQLWDSMQNKHGWIQDDMNFAEVKSMRETKVPVLTEEAFVPSINEEVTEPKIQSNAKRKKK